MPVRINDEWISGFVRCHRDAGNAGNRVAAQSTGARTCAVGGIVKLGIGVERGEYAGLRIGWVPDRNHERTVRSWFLSGTQPNLWPAYSPRSTPIPSFTIPPTAQVRAPVDCAATRFPAFPASRWQRTNPDIHSSFMRTGIYRRARTTRVRLKTLSAMGSLWWHW